MFQSTSDSDSSEAEVGINTLSNNSFFNFLIVSHSVIGIYFINFLWKPECYVYMLCILKDEHLWVVFMVKSIVVWVKPSA